MRRAGTMSVMRLSIRTIGRRDAGAVSVEEAAERVLAGDPDAFRHIFDRFSRPVTSFIFDIVGRRDLAEELAQETFVRAYRGLGSLRDGTKLSTWRFGIAKFTAWEAIRAERRRGSVGIDEIAEMPSESDYARPEVQLLGRELNGVIHEALAALDDDKRTVFSLRIFQQKSYDEIVDITGFTLAKVKTDLHRARSEMRRRVGPYVEGTV